MHHTDIKVRGYHLDLYGHVNNARYLEFLEEARWSYFERSGALEWFAQAGLAFVIVNININYRRSAYNNETLTIDTHIPTLGNRATTIKQVVRLKDSDTIVASADVTYVVVDTKQEKAVVLDGELRSKMEGIIAAAESE